MKNFAILAKIGNIQANN